MLSKVYTDFTRAAKVVFGMMAALWRYLLGVKEVSRWFLFGPGFKKSPIIDKIGETGYLYNAFSVLHYFSLFVMVGTTALVDLRVMGLAARRQTVSQLAGQLFPWMWTAFAIATISGFLEFAPTGASFAPDHFFQAKLVLIVLAVVFAVIVQMGAREMESIA